MSVQLPIVEKDVHTEHCCLKHGCKYGYGKFAHCTVASGEKPQSFQCEVCDYVLEEHWDDILAMDAAFEAGRRAVARTVLGLVQGTPDHPWIPGVVFKETDLLGQLRRWAGE